MVGIITPGGGQVVAELIESVRVRSGDPALVWSPAGPLQFEHLFLTWPYADWWKCRFRRPPRAECGMRAAELDPPPSTGGQRCQRCEALQPHLLQTLQAQLIAGGYARAAAATSGAAR